MPTHSCTTNMRACVRACVYSLFEKPHSHDSYAIAVEVAGWRDGWLAGWLTDWLTRWLASFGPYAFESRAGSSNRPAHAFALPNSMRITLSSSSSSCSSSSSSSSQAPVSSVSWIYVYHRYIPRCILLLFRFISKQSFSDEFRSVLFTRKL